MDRRDFIKRMGALALCLAGTGEGTWTRAAKLTGDKHAQSSDRTTRRLTILHTNDVHSHIDPFPADDPKYPGLGGYARRQAFIEKVRAEGNDTLVFECGDMFQGTPYFNFYKGKLEISLMNRMGIDAVTIGNHEFDNGLDILCDRIEEAQFPFLNANYSFTDRRAQRIVNKYKIFERCGIKIGVFGLGVEVEGLVTTANLKGTTYNDPVKCAQTYADKLRKMGCQMVIALTHIGYSMNEKIDDIKLAAYTTGIDMILGGHSHTFLPQPVFVRNKNNKDVLINQVGYAGINVGRIDIDITTGLLASANDSTDNSVDISFSNSLPQLMA
ncbi:MAG: metallophosphatase [Bacteroidales bacterium]|nr:metallophosphatase [Bacteroidales bacterium]